MWENLNNGMEIEEEKNVYLNWRIICAYWNNFEQLLIEGNSLASFCQMCYIENRKGTTANKVVALINNG